jgi:hypothetical protein
VLESARSGREIELIGVNEQADACRPEPGKNVAEGMVIVARIVSDAISEVGARKLFGVEKIVKPGEPEWLEIEQMPGVLLRRPLSVGFSSERCGGAVMEEFFQPCRRASQA